MLFASVEAYCQTWKQEGQKLHDQWDDAQRTAGGDPVASIAVLLGSASELAGFFGKLSKVAPEEIAPDVVRYKEALEQVASNLRGGTNLLEVVFSQLAVSAQAASVERRVDTWTKTHCGQGDLDG